MDSDVAAHREACGVTSGSGAAGSPARALFLRRPPQESRPAKALPLGGDAAPLPELVGRRFDEFRLLVAPCVR